MGKRKLFRGADWMTLRLIALIFALTGTVQAQFTFDTAQDLSDLVFGTVTNDNTGVIADIGAPNIAGSYPYAPLWYKWTAPQDGDVELDTVGSINIQTNIIFGGFDTNDLPIFLTNVVTANLDTVLGVYSGTNVAFLNQIAANNDLYPVNSSLSQQNASPDTENTSYSYNTQRYYGPSHLHFTAKGGQTYYFAVDTTFANGNIYLNWAYKSSGVFRFATEDYDTSTQMPLYQTAETESQTQSGTSGKDTRSVESTYYPYNAPGCLVTVTRTAGSVGRAVVHYQTEDGTNLPALPPKDLPAAAGVDYIPVSGDLVFDDFEMSKTILVPIIYRGLTPGDQTNRVFGIKLVDDGGVTSPQLDVQESGDVSPPRVDPVFGEAMIKILNVDADPYGPDLIEQVDTNSMTTNYVNALYPTNLIFNFQKANYRVPADVADPAIYPYNYVNVTLYVKRGGTNRAAATVNYRINNYLDANNTADEINNDFPLQPGSDYAIPTPPTISNIRGTNSDFDVADGTLSFPATGGNEVFYQPIHISIPLSKMTKFNKDFRIQLYRMVKVGDNNVPQITGMNAETTVTILFNDENPPAGSVDEFYNADFSDDFAMLPPRPVTSIEDNQNPGVGSALNPGQVYSIAVLTNDEAFIGGDFPTYNGASSVGVALVGTNGQADTTFNPGSGVSGDIDHQGNDAKVNAVAVSGNQFYIGGNFTAYNNNPAVCVARLNANGGLDATFNTSQGPNGSVRALAVWTNGEVLIGGDFTEINGKTRDHIALLNTNGAVDESFDPTNILDGSVYALAVKDGQILVGGNFSVNGQTYRNIARLNTDGSLDTSFSSSTGADDIIHALGWQPDGKIIAGGEFTHVNGLAYNHIARFNADGSIDTTNFFVGTAANDIVFSVNVQPDGTIYVGGAFDSFNGTRRSRFARLYSNGTVDTTFMDTAYNQFAGLKKIYSWDSPAVFASAVQNNGGVLIGGSFLQVGGGQADPNVCNALDDELFLPYFGSEESFADPNLWVEPKARDGVRNRTGFARLIGGSTPGPGNLGLASTSYSQNKSQSSLAVSLVRTNGTLGPISANFFVTPGLALAGQDYRYQSDSPLDWIAWNYISNPTRQREDGLSGASGSLVDPLGLFLPLADVSINNLSKVTVGIISNPKNPGDLNAQFQLANPNLDTFYLGGEEIPLGAALGASSAPFKLIDDTTSPGQFGFKSDNYFITNSPAVITLVRSNGTFGNVKVVYSTTNGTAISGVGKDYVGVTSGSQTFNSGVLATNFNITILNNNSVSNIDKTFNVKLTQLQLTPGATFGISNATVHIINPNFSGYVTLSASNYTGTIGSGAVTFTVNRIVGSLGTLSVQYATTNGPSAVSGVDFIGSTNTLTWNSGDVTPKTISVPLLNPEVIGGVKQFGVKLFNSTNNGVSAPSIIGVISNASLVISNDNSYGALQFSAPFYNVNENGGYTTISVLRSSGTAGTASIDFATSDGVNTTSGNYYPTNGTLVFGPGVSDASFRVYIKDDGTADYPPDNFYFNVTLSNPTNATSGSPTNAQVRIFENNPSYNPGLPDGGFYADGMNGNVFALSLNSSGKILASGNFTAVGDTPRSRIARLNTDGTLDTGFLNLLSGANAAVNAVVCQSDDRILIGGAFTTVDDINRYFIARLQPDGTVDTSFNPGSGADNAVNAIAETFAVSGTNLVRKIYLGGAFSSVNVNPSAGIGRLNNDGTVDYGFNVGSGADGPVYAVAVYPTNSIYWGKVLVGGDFGHFNGVTVSNLVRLNFDGSLDTNYIAALGSNANAAVRALAVQLDGKVLVGGNFTNFNGTAVSRLIRLNTDGSLDTDFATAVSGGNGAVEAIAVQPDNRIVVSGQFTSFNGVTRNHITRLLPTGATDFAINFGTGANGDVDALAIQPTDGMIVLGGAFSQYNGETHENIARIYGGSVTGSGAFEFTSANFLTHESAVVAAVTVRRTGGTSGTNSDGSGNVLVHFATSDGTATNGINYLGISTNVVFAPGEVLRTVLVPVLDDFVVKPDLTANLTLSSPTPPATLGNQSTATLTISNDDNSVSFSSATYAQVKNTPTGIAVIDIVRNGGVNSSASVDYFTPTNGTAVIGTDYYPTNGTVTFNPGISDVQIQVPVINNGLVEGNKTVLLALTNAVNTILASPSNAVLTIIDTVSAPGQLSFEATNYVVSETDGNAYVTVIRTNGSSGSVSVNYSIVPGTALPVVNYVDASGSVTFGNGEIAKTIAVQLVNNSQVQGTVNFSVVLSNPTGGATLTPPTATTVSILDNDTGVSFLNATNYVSETNGFGSIVVQRIGNISNAFQVNFTTTNGTALAGTNYTTTAGTLSFVSGEVFKNISVPLFNQHTPTNLTFGVTLSAPVPAQLLAPSNALVVLQGGNAGLSFTNSTLSVFKNVGVVALPVICNNPGLEPIIVDSNTIPLSVSYFTADGTAIAGQDYTVTSGTLIFTNGIGTNYIFVPIINNSLITGSRTFTVCLTNATATGKVTWPSNQVVTIIDSNSGLSFSRPAYTALKTDASASITVLRTDNTNTTSSVSFATADGTAIAGADYFPTNGTIIFTNGETSHSFVVKLISSGQVQPDKTVLLQLFNPTNGFLIAPSAAILTIHDTTGSFVVPAGSALLHESLITNGIIDPGESVAMLFAFRAAGGIDVSNLSAMLLVTNGVTSPSPATPVNYGTLAVGGPPVFRQFGFTANGTNSQTIAATFQLNDGATSLGIATFTYTLGTWTMTFSNTNSIIIKDALSYSQPSMAAPYPSSITISNVNGTVVKTTITLTNMTHGSASDVNALLVAPNQADALFMSHAGTPAVGMNGVTLKFDDAATNSLPYLNGQAVTNGVYKPSTHPSLPVFP